MSDVRFTLEDAGSICIAPFLQRELQLENIRQASAAQEAARVRGVAWSGLGGAPLAPPRPLDQVRLDAEAALHRARAFAQTSRGRFLAGLRDLDALGYAAQAEVARAAFARGFADPARPACCAEIGCALNTLARLDLVPAHKACLALAELLTEALKLAAE